MNVNQKALDDLGVKPFDVAEHFHDEEFMLTYLKEILTDGDVEELAEALGDIARYKGRTGVLEAEGFTQAVLVDLLVDPRSRKDIVNRVLEICGVDARLKPFVTQSVVFKRRVRRMSYTDLMVGKKGMIMGTIKRRKESKKLA